MSNLLQPLYTKVTKTKKRKKQPVISLPSNDLISLSDNDDDNDNNIVPPFKKLTTKSTSILGQIANTPEEQRRRELRSQRFMQDKVVKKQDDNNIITIEEGSDVWQFKPVIGTSTDIEKPYFRLTSAADPRTVRPLSILKKTYKHLRKKWRKEHNYSYICEQFKSMRQDLTVQCIRNEFTVKVYETHARIALEKGDCSQYNQCGSQLKYLYDQGIPGNVDEFTAYRLLYFLHTQNWADINSLLGEIKKKGNHQSECVNHALQVRSAIATGNYHRLFKLYEEAPNMGGYLMDQFIERERIQALIILCKSYQLGIPVGFIVQELLFNNVNELVSFFNKHGISRIRGTHTIDTKATLPKLQEASKKFSRIDIKGQI
ncbi:SAC3/GANP/Nin1/mts3/eIF-3 p25 family-domain-containing protein [Halteromyces radiatus]|uniref:SAC3/GANP/Nin1/mts3/eIF-3 p25 family-domain-containing protein n=1 Tax=Halteromyces radiatus TaxID=101107 RepID=UPI00221FE7DD|nr:SAC3/GANP/Nin1/mts3/eIF-3 p25 family-domain-containing protein [Halteromyces radiatus]KAI8098809.1 SAC3/GANP/Nin1/mts3/eIF-3 p25 family-domain-containing protein [Halteromyces radiatus]